MEHISEHLTPVPQNKELQKQESKPLKNGKALRLARQSVLIFDAHDADLSAVLKYVMVKLGLRAKNLPDETEKSLLLSHLRNNYGKLTINEICLAFELAMNEELDISPDDVNCYENFSCAYVSRILNSYISWAVQELKQIPDELPQPKIYTQEEIDNENRRLVEEFYQRLRRGIAEPVPQYAYEILVKDGLIRKDQSPVGFFVYELGRQKQHIYEKK